MEDAVCQTCFLYIRANADLSSLFLLFHSYEKRLYWTGGRWLEWTAAVHVSTLDLTTPPHVKLKQIRYHPLHPLWPRSSALCPLLLSLRAQPSCLVSGKERRTVAKWESSNWHRLSEHLGSLHSRSGASGFSEWHAHLSLEYAARSQLCLCLWDTDCLNEVRSVRVRDI